MPRRVTTSQCSTTQITFCSLILLSLCCVDIRKSDMSLTNPTKHEASDSPTKVKSEIQADPGNSSLSAAAPLFAAPLPRLHRGPTLSTLQMPSERSITPHQRWAIRQSWRQTSATEVSWNIYSKGLVVLEDDDFREIEKHLFKQGYKSTPPNKKNKNGRCLEVKAASPPENLPDGWMCSKKDGPERRLLLKISDTIGHTENIDTLTELFAQLPGIGFNCMWRPPHKIADEVFYLEVMGTGSPSIHDLRRSGVQGVYVKSMKWIGERWLADLTISSSGSTAKNTPGPATTVPTIPTFHPYARPGKPQQPAPLHPVPQYPLPQQHQQPLHPPPAAQWGYPGQGWPTWPTNAQGWTSYLNAPPAQNSQAYANTFNTTPWGNPPPLIRPELHRSQSTFFKPIEKDDQAKASTSAISDSESCLNESEDELSELNRRAAGGRKKRKTSGSEEDQEQGRTPSTHGNEGQDLGVESMSGS